jgi:hypothetical protein
LASVLFRSLSLIGPVLVATALGTGCSSAEVSAVGSLPTPMPMHTYGPDASDAAPAVETSEAAAAAVTFRGNPICHASVTSCFPDDLTNPCGVDFDGLEAGPSEAANALAGYRSTPACHVIETPSGAVETTCAVASHLQGMSGSACTESTDCSPGWECVAGGTCRRYCCGGNSACSNNQFCDVQPTAENPALVVPVCQLEVPCTLLADVTCPPNEQCTVVREDGSTSCVAVGTVGDMGSCDTEHCARGYVCLGPTGSRFCAPLCSTTGPDSCLAPRTCTGSLPLFPNPSVGACQ